MKKLEIENNLTNVFREVFSNTSIIISDDLSAKDIDGWDSLTHMLLIVEIENFFSIKFKLKDLNKMKNVGDMIKIIETKMN
tara:strand:- start:62 stop:304 length:243 start_codon:yes stop_codon:yes gene_type:complete